MQEFRYYNHCLIQNTAPHITPNIDDIELRITKENAYLARWTSNFNCDKETQWWYLIKDDEYNPLSLKSKDRYEINKGKKFFRTDIINPNDYKSELYNIFYLANEKYSKLSRNHTSFDDFCSFNEEDIYIASFDVKTGELSAYAICSYYDIDKNTVNLSVLKILPAKRNMAVSAALMDFICNYFINNCKVNYICDGERSIRHITNFQEYLIKYFGFRKVFCNLNLKYSKKLSTIVKILFPFRSIIKKISKFSHSIYNIYCILRQEEIYRTFK